MRDRIRPRSVDPILRKYARSVGLGPGYSAHSMRDPPERRGVFIPIVFHFVLAAFLFVHGSAGLVAR